MIKELKTNKGITLIALVITIIVLLILAGVAISMLSGENGILNKAAIAKTETEKASAEEVIKLAAMSALTVGNGKIQGEDAFKTLNDELKDAGYKGEKINELPATVAIDGNDYVIADDGTIGELETIADLKESGMPVTKEKVTLTDKKGYIITIPMNFNIVSESPEEVTKGIIIEDSEDNQYVWIPVFTSEQYDWGVDWSATKTAEETYESNKTEENETAYYTAIQTALKSYTSTYADSSYTDVWYGDASYGQYYYINEEGKTVYYTNGNMKKEDYNKLYNNMLKSVYKNGGFYIGRYEMGKAIVTSTDEAQEISRTKASKEYISSTTNTSNEEPTIKGMTAPVSKANAIPYNYITQSQAQMLAEELGKKADYSNVESSIMFGVQWDAVCVFIEKFDTNNNAETKSQWLTNNTFSKLWGNYSNSTFKLDQGYYTTTYSSTTVTWNKDYTTAKGTSTLWLYTTGASNQNSSLHIYDFAGDLAEWTLEMYNDASIPSVYRGSTFGRSGYASYRGSCDTYYSDYYRSSRSTLYIK